MYSFISHAVGHRYCLYVVVVVVVAVLLFSKCYDVFPEERSGVDGAGGKLGQRFTLD